MSGSLGMPPPPPQPAGGAGSPPAPGGMAPGGMDPAGPMGAGGAPPHPGQPIFDQHEALEAQFKSLVKASKMNAQVTTELTALAKMKDTVTEGEVIEAASRLVGKGYDAKKMAGMIAGMPVGGGQVLGQWVTSLQTQMGQKDQELQGLLKTTQHEMGVTSLHGIMAHTVAHHMEQQAGGGMPQPQGAAPMAPNALMAQGPEAIEGDQS